MATMFLVMTPKRPVEPAAEERSKEGTQQRSCGRSGSRGG